MATETLRMRCLRCGEWHESAVDDPYLPLICHPCFTKGTDILFADGSASRFNRWCARWEKGQERHPAFLALEAAWARFVAARKEAARHAAHPHD